MFVVTTPICCLSEMHPGAIPSIAMHMPKAAARWEELCIDFIVHLHVYAWLYVHKYMASCLKQSCIPCV